MHDANSLYQSPIIVQAGPVNPQLVSGS